MDENKYTAIDFLWSLLLDNLKDILIIFLSILIGEWVATKWNYSLIERAWLITLIVIALLTFVVWVRWGRLILWM